MSAQHNIGDLNSVLSEYQRLRRMTAYDVLTIQGAKLGREIFYQLKAIAPPAGEIRQEIFARLLTGKGIKIRQSARDKTDIKMGRHWVQRFGYRPGKRKKRRKDAKNLNYQNELVKREIGTRESGRRALAVSIRYSPKRLVDRMASISRHGFILSTVGIAADENKGIAQFRWDERSPMSKSIMEGIARSRAQAAISKAVEVRRQDMLVYIRRKHTEAATRAVRKMVAPQQKWSQAALTSEIRRVTA